MIDPTKLDPFTTVYRGRYNTRAGKRYHLNPACPALGPKPLKGRLGATLLSGRSLCSVEGGPRESMPRPAKYGGGRINVSPRVMKGPDRKPLPPMLGPRLPPHPLAPFTTGVWQ